MVKKKLLKGNGKNKQANKFGLYARVKAAAKRKFPVYPSAYANMWLVRGYKKRGGTYVVANKPKAKGRIVQEKSSTRRVKGGLTTWLGGKVGWRKNW